MPKKEGAKEKAANKAAAAAEDAGVLLCAREPPLAGAAGRAFGENLRGLQPPQPTDAPGVCCHAAACMRPRAPGRGPRERALGGISLRLCRCPARACCCCRLMPLLLPGLNRAAAAGCEAEGFFADALAAGEGPLMRQASRGLTAGVGV